MSSNMISGYSIYAKKNYFKKLVTMQILSVNSERSQPSFSKKKTFFCFINQTY